MTGRQCENIPKEMNGTWAKELPLRETKRIIGTQQYNRSKAKDDCGSKNYWLKDSILSDCLDATGVLISVWPLLL